MRMLFVSNHDKNAWEGTEFEQFGDGLETAIVLSVVSEGMPLIYNGQEAGNPRRLAFFEKDPIEWREHPLGDLYKKLFALKKENTALWNGKWGARMINVPNSAQTQVLSFVRQNKGSKVFAVFNFSAKPQVVTLYEALYYGTYHEHFSEEAVEFSGPTQVELMPWEYRVYVSG
jgi:1,4-alpha-glucan branching enzyme